MSRYIEVSMAQAVFDEGDKSLFDIAPSIDMIPKDFHDRVCEEMTKRHQAEIANMVEVVRCKECKHYDNEDYGEPTRYCTWHESVVKADDFCSYGERGE